MSNIGAFIWAAAAAVCFIAFVIARDQITPGVNSRFLLAGGCLTVMWLLDEFFTLHQGARELGLYPELLFGIYANVSLWFFVRFHATIMRSDYLLLVLALAGFGTSLFIDVTAPYHDLPGVFVLEDGSKIIGIVSWAAYWLTFSARHLGSGTRDDRHGKLTATP